MSSAPTSRHSSPRGLSRKRPEASGSSTLKWLHTPSASPWWAAARSASARSARRPATGALAKSWACRSVIGGPRVGSTARAVAALLAQHEQVEAFHLLARPGRLAQELQARRHAGVVGEAAQRDALAQAGPAIVRCQRGDDGLQRQAVQRVAGLGRGVGGIGGIGGQIGREPGRIFAARAAAPPPYPPP